VFLSAQYFFGALGIVGSRNEPDSAAHREVGPLPAAIIATDHTFDAEGLKRCLRDVGLKLGGERSNGCKIVLRRIGLGAGHASSSINNTVRRFLAVSQGLCLGAGT
jgi:hypothetical protein